MGEAPLLLALDFGGTKHAAAVTHQGQRHWLGRRRQLRNIGAQASTDLRQVLALAGDLLNAHLEPIAAVGVAFNGPMNFETGRVHLSHHATGWDNYPLRDELEKHFGVPVSVDNDANVAALGEYRFGAGQSSKSLLYVTVSTGVGAGWVLEGRVYRGAQQLAGELGHLTVRPAGPLCACGRRGCVEILASGPAIAREARNRIEAHAARHRGGLILRELVKDNLSVITAELVAHAADRGDPLAQAVLLEAARDFGTGLGMALSLMNPASVVLGGGVTQAGEKWWAEVRRAAHANTLPEISAEILPAALGADSPLWGGIALAEDLLSRD